MRRARELSTRALGFMLVGVIGFLTDAAVLTVAMSGLGLGPLAGRALSFPLALAVTWLLNRSFTFGGSLRDFARPGRVLREFGAYCLFQSVGMALNLGIYSGLVSATAHFAHYPVKAVAVGSVVAMVWNFLSAQYLVFRPRPGVDRD